MMKFARPGVTITALALVGATALAACGKTSSSNAPSTGLGGSFGHIPAAATGAQHAGTITWAEAPGTAPTWILPLVTSAADAVNNSNEFSNEMWRPLYWFSNGVEPTQTPAMSLADPEVVQRGQDRQHHAQRQVQVVRRAADHF